eukprot:gene14594-biopygen7876
MANIPIQSARRAASASRPPFGPKVGRRDSVTLTTTTGDDNKVGRRDSVTLTMITTTGDGNNYWQRQQLAITTTRVASAPACCCNLLRWGAPRKQPGGLHCLQPAQSSQATRAGNGSAAASPCGFGTTPKQLRTAVLIWSGWVGDATTRRRAFAGAGPGGGGGFFVDTIAGVTGDEAADEDT